MVGGPTGQPIPPETIGPTLLTSATNKGKFLAHCQWGGSDSPTRFSGKIIELDESFSDDPQLLAGVRAYYRRLADRDFTPDQTPFVDRLLPHPADYRLAGTQSCGKCHPAEYETWATTAHAQAWESVEKKGAHVDPECQRCHVTGYGLPGGFASVRRTPEMVQVGCENCHGPSQSHVADPAVHTSRFASASTSCLECHDVENSPHFDYETYWTRIRHADPTPSGTPSATTSENPSEDRP